MVGREAIVVAARAGQRRSAEPCVFDLSSPDVPPSGTFDAVDGGRVAQLVEHLHGKGVRRDRIWGAKRQNEANCSAFLRQRSGYGRSYVVAFERLLAPRAVAPSMAMMARWSCCLATAVAARLPAVRCSASSEAGVAARVGRALRSAGCGDAPFTSRVMSDLDVGQSSLRARERSRVGVIDRRRATADGDSKHGNDALRAAASERDVLVSAEARRSTSSPRMARQSPEPHPARAPAAARVELEFAVGAWRLGDPAVPLTRLRRPRGGVASGMATLASRRPALDTRPRARERRCDRGNDATVPANRHPRRGSSECS